MTDAVEAVREGVNEEAANELIRHDRHGLVSYSSLSDHNGHSGLDSVGAEMPGFLRPTRF